MAMPFKPKRISKLPNAKLIRDGEVVHVENHVMAQAKRQKEEVMKAFEPRLQDFQNMSTAINNFESRIKSPYSVGGPKVFASPVQTPFYRKTPYDRHKDISKMSELERQQYLHPGQILKDRTEKSGFRYREGYHPDARELEYKIHGDNLFVNNKGQSMYKKDYDTKKAFELYQGREKDINKAHIQAIKTNVGIDKRNQALKEIHGDNVQIFGNQVTYKEGYDHEAVKSEWRNQQKIQNHIDKEVKRAAYIAQNQRGPTTAEVPEILQNFHGAPDKGVKNSPSPKALAKEIYNDYETSNTKGVAKHLTSKTVGLQNRYQQILDGVKSGKVSPEQLEQHAQGLGKSMGYKGEDLIDFVNKYGSTDTIADAAGIVKSHRYEANLMDKAIGNKIPQMAAGGLGTAWLVSNMASSKGQQTNGQLYGQQTPYY